MQSSKELFVDAVWFDARNDPNLGQRSEIQPRFLLLPDGHGRYGGIDNLLAVWQSNNSNTPI